jgi:large subunit ribosomal protein L14e
LIDGPCTSVCRQAINFKYLSLTDFKIKVSRSARSGPVKKAFEAEEIQAKWEKTAWSRKLVMRKKRTTLTDFDRFKLKLAKQKVS